MEEFICIHCGMARKNLNSLRQHQVRCTSNPNGVLVKKTIWTDELRLKQSKKMKECNTNAQRVYTDEQRKQMSERFKISNKKFYSDPKNRKKHSEIMKQVVRNNSESYSASNVSGRVKIFEYNGFKLKGRWELLVAEWLDKNNINWTNKISGFNYFWNSGEHIYFPDFYLIDYDIYLEVKGYETERDRMKWKYFPKKLVILKLVEINLIKTNQFILENILHF
jgi:hypothetical protein